MKVTINKSKKYFLNDVTLFMFYMYEYFASFFFIQKKSTTTTNKITLFSLNNLIKIKQI